MASNYDAASDRDVSIGRIFSRAFGTMGGNPITVFGVCFLFGGLPGVAINLISRNLGYSTEAFRTGALPPAAFFAITVAIWLIALAFSMLTQAALVRATIAHSEGRQAGLGESIMSGLAAILPLIGLAIVTGLGVGLATLLFIVPGIILYLIWAVAAPALVAERIGIFEAMNRSSYLTKGSRWTIFALGLILVVIYIIFGSITAAVIFGIYGLQGAAGLARSGLPISFLIVSGAFSTILKAVISTIQTSLYVELRNAKDGAGTNALSDVFA